MMELLGSCFLTLLLLHLADHRPAEEILFSTRNSLQYKKRKATNFHSFLPLDTTQNVPKGERDEQTVQWMDIKFVFLRTTPITEAAFVLVKSYRGVFLWAPQEIIPRRTLGGSLKSDWRQEEYRKFILRLVLCLVWGSPFRSNDS